VKSGVATIVVLLAVAFLGIASIPVVTALEVSASPSPSPTVEPTPTSSPTAISTTLPAGESLDINNSDSSVHVQNTGNGSVIHVETSGDGSADVSVKSHIESSTTVSSASHTTLEVSGSSN
jgi:hypothetical protein